MISVFILILINIKDFTEMKEKFHHRGANHPKSYFRLVECIFGNPQSMTGNTFQFDE